MNKKTWYKPFIIWFWSLFIGGILVIWLVMWLITKGALGYLPPLEELRNPKNTFASEIISADMQSLGRYYRFDGKGDLSRSDIAAYDEGRAFENGYRAMQLRD